MKKINLSKYLNDLVQTVRSDKWFYLSVAIIFIYAAISRFIGLEFKTLHHDESIHAYYSWVLNKDGHYAYDPLSHGPLLYYLISISYDLFGINDGVARYAPALFGTLIIPLLLWTRRFWSRWTVILIMLLVATSPMLTYVSRFSRHDMISIFLNLTIILATISYLQKPKPVFIYILMIAYGFSFSNHEMTYITAALWAFTLGLTVWRMPKSKRTDLWKIFKDRDLWHMLFAGSIGLFVMLLFFSSFGTNGEGLKRMLPNPWDPQSSLGYWMAQQAVRRANQPFHFYILQMVVYDLLPFLLGIAALIYGLKKVRHGYVIAFLIVALMVFIYPSLDITGEFISKKQGLIGVGLKHLPQLLLALFFVLAGIGFEDSSRRFMTIFAGLTVLSFAIASEKMPWLTSHSLIVLLLAGGFFFDDFYPRLKFKVKLPLVIIAVAMIGFSVFNSYRLCMLNPDNPKEFAVYVQSQPILKEIARSIANDPTKPRVVIGPDMSWPMSWYLRDVPNEVSVVVDRIDPPQYILLSQSEATYNGWASQKYNNIELLPFRSWWVPAKGYPGFNKLLKYYFKREVWNKSGFGSFDFIYLSNLKK